MLLVILRVAVPIIAGVAAAALIAIQTRRLHRPHEAAPPVKCGICRQGLQITGRKRELVCGHQFHYDCIQMVFNEEVTKSCPIRNCREIMSHW